MSQQTTYILTFKSSVPDEQDRRANLNGFIKEALRKYRLRLVNMRTEKPAKAKRAPLNPRVKISRDGRPYVDIIDAVNKRLDRIS
jgi:UTP:GlnB (protein PII) uridylyltransferase